MSVWVRKDPVAMNHSDLATGLQDRGGSNDLIDLAKTRAFADSVDAVGFSRNGLRLELIAYRAKSVYGLSGSWGILGAKHGILSFSR